MSYCDIILQNATIVKKIRKGGLNMAGYPYLDVVVYNNFYEMLHSVYDKTPEEIAIRYREKETIRDISYREMLEETASFYFYLNKHKIHLKLLYNSKNQA